jgi:glycosyltransferase involved in cell wall biosynthesis
MGAALAEQLEPLNVQHIHAHHGYFRLVDGVNRRATAGHRLQFYLARLRSAAARRSARGQTAACRFCVTISDFNRQLHTPQLSFHAAGENYRAAPGGRSRAAPGRQPPLPAEPRRFCLLAVGRLHRVKDYGFLIQACASLRDQGTRLSLLDRGRGAGASALERQIAELGAAGTCLPDRTRAARRPWPPITAMPTWS